MQFFGLVFLITTFCICLWKKEKSPDRETQCSIEDELTIKETYFIVLKLFKLPTVKKLVLVLLTCKVNNIFYN